MRYVPLLLLVALAAQADLDAGMSAGVAFPVGQWGRQFGTGLDLGAHARWRLTRGIGAGLGLSAQVYGDAYDGDASLLVLAPSVSTALHLRPGARSFNPGLEASFGLARSVMTNAGGEDPATWDPFWRAGFRWDFGMGPGWRGAVGFDFSGVMGEGESADCFELVMRISRGVEL